MRNQRQSNKRCSNCEYVTKTDLIWCPCCHVKFTTRIVSGSRAARLQRGL